MKAVFDGVTWDKGTPVLPGLSEEFVVDGTSAMENITGSGVIRAQIEADEATINELKSHLVFVETVPEEE